MSPTTEQFDQLTRDELLALVKELIPIVQLVPQLQQRITELEAEVEQLKSKSTNSRNSSQPPSRDHKSNQPSDKPKKKYGPPFGHQRSVRALIDHPDQTLSLKVEQCAQCQHDLNGVAPERIIRRQVTELPEFKPVVIETQQHEILCPHCQSLNRSSLPEGLEVERYFGPRLEATVVFLKHQQHLSYERIVLTLRELFGLELSEGGVASIIARAGERAALAAAQIKQQVISSLVILSDETSARVKGRNFWHWVFIGASAVYHQIVERRNAAVIAQLKAPAQVFQLCLAHQLRDLERLADQPCGSVWAAEG